MDRYAGSFDLSYRYKVNPFKPQTNSARHKRSSFRASLIPTAVNPCATLAEVYGKHHDGFVFPRYVYDPVSIQRACNHFDNSALGYRDWNPVPIPT